MAPVPTMPTFLPRSLSIGWWRSRRCSGNPIGRVEGVAFEGVDTRDAGKLGFVKDAARRDEVLAADLIAAAGGDEPAALVVVPHRVGDLGLKGA